MVKVAFPTDDGKTISRHFGQAPMFVVATIQGDEPSKFEQRGKGFHGHHVEQHDHEHNLTGHNHVNMLTPIADCQVLIAGGMGQPAYDSAVANGLQVILTGETTIEAALNAYRAGILVSDPRRIHKHRLNNSFVESRDI
jgi:predicted Fe-Mo cluster-binding NifX family protein